jgi:hypothetical protein
MKKSRFGTALRGGVLLFASISAIVVGAMAIRFAVLGIRIDASLIRIVLVEATKGGAFGGLVGFALVFAMFPKSTRPQRD